MLSGSWFLRRVLSAALRREHFCWPCHNDTSFRPCQTRLFLLRKIPYGAPSALSKQASGILSSGYEQKRPCTYCPEVSSSFDSKIKPYLNVFVCAYTGGK